MEAKISRSGVPAVAEERPLKAGRCRKHTYPATTLPELLVVMVAGGIVFLLAFEAWNTVGYYGKRWTEKSLSESTFFTAVFRLEALCGSADSLTADDTGWTVHRSTGSRMCLYRWEGCLVVHFKGVNDGGQEFRDTLFRNVERIRGKKKSVASKRVDSLYVLFRIGGRRKEVGFGCPGRWKTVSRIEEDR